MVFNPIEARAGLVAASPTKLTPEARELMLGVLKGAVMIMVSPELHQRQGSTERTNTDGDGVNSRMVGVDGEHSKRSSANGINSGRVATNGDNSQMNGATDGDNSQLDGGSDGGYSQLNIGSKRVRGDAPKRGRAKMSRTELKMAPRGGRVEIAPKVSSNMLDITLVASSIPHKWEQF